MSAYDLIGSISAVFFMLALIGILDQIRTLHRRRLAAGTTGEQVTAVLSLNQFGCHFLGVYAFFVYGFCIETFNPYLVWPRLVATVLVLTVLMQILIDRKSMSSALVFTACLVATLGALVLLASGYRAWETGGALLKILVVAVTLINAQGYTHQLLQIRRTRSTGAISLPMNLLIFLKDVSSFALGVVMGFETGWPVMLLNGVNGLFRFSIVSQFYWVRSRRAATAAPAAGAE